jgi:hypothetical protein
MGQHWEDRDDEGRQMFLDQLEGRDPYAQKKLKRSKGENLFYIAFLLWLAYLWWAK